MITTHQVDALTGRSVVGPTGDKLGKVGDVYLDDTSGQPEWATVNTGLFGSSQSFVPLREATIFEGDLQVSYDKDMVKGAPRVGDDGHLSPAEEDELYRYYGLEELAGGSATTDTDTTADTDTTTGAVRSQTDTGRSDRVGERAGERTGERDVAAHDTSAPTTDDAMTRSEEELRVGTRSREAGRARLRKYVVTERESVTVPVSHEEVTIEREPITNASYDAAVAGAAISEEEHEIVLHEEVPVVSKDVHAVERVRLDATTVSEEQQVSDEVRKEQIAMETLDTTDGTSTDGTSTDGTSTDVTSTDRTTRGTAKRKH